jgi:uncharacterized protein YjbI with pentapeptide repeats
VNLQEADLRAANLRKAHLEGAYLQRADLREADLRGTHLQGADLREAKLQGAHFHGAELCDVKLAEEQCKFMSGARFENCKDVSQTLDHLADTSDIHDHDWQLQ